MVPLVSEPPQKLNDACFPSGENAGKAARKLAREPRRRERGAAGNEYRRLAVSPSIMPPELDSSRLPSL